jgi:hypothetical protein
VRTHRNNQDAVAVTVTDDWVVGVVADGCSAGRYSEVGARLGATLLANWLPHFARHGDDGPHWVRALEAALIGELRATALGLHPDPALLPALVRDYFLFSYLAVAVGRERTHVLGAGDGVFSINGQGRVLDPGPDNAPAYPAYALLEERCLTRRFTAGPCVHASLPTDEVRSILVGSDGLAELHARAGQALPDGSPAGLEQFERDPHLLKNPTLAHKRLVVLGERHRLLGDDTSLIVVRRREA